VKVPFVTSAERTAEEKKDIYPIERDSKDYITEEIRKRSIKYTSLTRI